METLIIYDITDDNLRNKIATILKDFGCMRIQKSAFLGDLNTNLRDKLKIKLEKILGDEFGNIQIYPLCSKCFGLRKNIGENYNVEEEMIL